MKTLAGDIQGEPALITRFILPQEPPQDFTPEEFTQFVSRIPFVQDVHLGDVRCTKAKRRFLVKLE